MMKMNRYLYSIGNTCDEKVIHISGNVYENDVDDTETCFRIAECTGLEIPINEAKTMMKEGVFYEFVNENVAYLEDVTEKEAEDVCNHYFSGKPGEMLLIEDITETTPCGDYWFDELFEEE